MYGNNTNQQLPPNPKPHSRSGISIDLFPEARALQDALPRVGRDLCEMYAARVVCFDFDGTLHTLDVWSGAAVCGGAPVVGALEMVGRVLGLGYSVSIFSARSCQVGGRSAMCGWINQWASELGIGDGLGDALFYPVFKPSAWLTFDDRAVTAAGGPTWDFWTAERLAAGVGCDLWEMNERLRNECDALQAQLKEANLTVEHLQIIRDGIADSAESVRREDIRVLSKRISELQLENERLRVSNALLSPQIIIENTDNSLIDGNPKLACEIR